jgi:hypothetical protein
MAMAKPQVTRIFPAAGLAGRTVASLICIGHTFRVDNQARRIEAAHCLVKRCFEHGACSNVENDLEGNAENQSAKC